MAEPIRGKLVWLKVGTGRERRVMIPNKQGELKPFLIKPEELAPELRASVEDGVDVDLERDKSGLPVRVRPAGQQWQAPAAPTPPPRSQPRPPSPAGRGPTRQPGSGPAGVRSGPALPPEFHNPYNFVPALPRTQLSPGSSELADRPPTGHDRYQPDSFSGCIGVKLSLATPLILPDAAEGWEDRQSGHKTFDVRVGADRRPALPATSIKGMLRAAYEAVTNSRLSVFRGHDRRLAYRMAARIDCEPARIESGPGDRPVVRVFKQLWNRAPARLRSYQRRSRARDKGRYQEALRYAGTDRLPALGDHVWARVAPNGLVQEIREHAGTSKPAGADWYEGWACITGPNINSKVHERVFVASSQDVILAADGLDRLWEDLIRDYQETHARELDARKRNGERPEDYLGDTPGRTGWSPHVYDKSTASFGEGLLCYVQVRNGKVVGIFPVTISRRLFSSSPADLLPEKLGLRPASSREDLSPADRVFGWVNQDGQGGYRGNVRFGPVRCETEDAIERFASPGLPLAILGQPKPQQARFYLAADAEGGAIPPGELAAYEANRGLRGRKVYPHHRGLPEGYWDDPTTDRTQEAVRGYHQDYRRPTRIENGRDRTRDDQNRSVLGWVRAGTVFTFDLHVTNLSKVELGALLWLLRLPPDHCHRLGGGKPLGFGSARLEVTGHDLRDGEAWRRWYRSLDGTAGPSSPPLDLAEIEEAFRAEVAARYGAGRPFEGVPFIAAFLRAARGFEDGLPIHYPRAREPGRGGPVPPHPEGRAYEWFVANNRTGGPNLGLPDLESGRGLPLLEARATDANSPRR